MSTFVGRRRRLTGLAVALAATAIATTGAGGHPAASASLAATPDVVADGYGGTLTFDWPVGCAATVTQLSNDIPPAESIESTFTVGIPVAPPAGANPLVTFGPAEIVDGTATDGSPIDAGPSALLTNPAIEILPDGTQVVAVAYEEWSESFVATHPLDDGPMYSSEAAITMRSAVYLWPAWVGVWSQAAAVDDGLDEFVGLLGTVDDGAEVDAGLVAVVDDDDLVEAVADVGDATSPISVTVMATFDPDTLQPVEAALTFDRGTATPPPAEFYWEFDWSACDDAPLLSESVAVSPATTAPETTAPETTDRPDGQTTGGDDGPSSVTVPGFDTISIDELPPEALDTLALIDSGGPFPYRQDDAVFENREGILPDRPYGYYREYTVETPGSDDRGARRLVAGEAGELFYTDDHYDSFLVVIR